MLPPLLRTAQTACRLLFLVLLLITGVRTWAQRNTLLWREVPETAITARANRYIIPERYRTFVLETAAMRRLLQQAPGEMRTAVRASTLVVPLPLPDGRTVRFRLVESQTLAPRLAARFPEIRTYAGVGLDDASLTAAIDFTPAGFHAMIHSPETGLSFIDPYAMGTTGQYIVYAKADLKFTAAKRFVEPAVLPADPETSRKMAQRLMERQAARLNGTLAGKPSGDQLRTYRIAIAATGEYTAFHGGTVATALAAITTTLNRVNFIYIREVAIRMQLIGNNNSIIYTNGSTDPYSNGDAFAMLGQNQSNLTTVIGTANFDIGHVFGTNSGGVAALASVCAAGSKAQGVTGSAAPVGDPFDVDYVAHEIGHQFGANHTFNGNTGACGGGNRNPPTAFEPGSGSTIMAYAGICAPQDLQPNSDAYFHTISYEEIFAFSEQAGGNTCAVITNVANGAPVPAIVTPNNLFIPKQTPFTITGSATDPNGDAITYNWEQFNLGPAGSPTAPSGDAPIFRSFNATSSPSRTFPKQSDLLNNTATIGEQLPTYSRTLVFNLTVRDNNPQAGGVSWAYPLNVVVAGTAGPFLVTAPNSSVSWSAGSSQTVSWDVSGTNLAPINCSQVNIRLSTDGGVTFPTILAAATPNDGSEVVTLPNVATTSARIKVEAVGNIFFDLSNANFSITGGGGSAPAAPVSLVATAISSSQIRLDWRHLNTTRTTRFRIERSLSAGGPFALVTTVSANQNSYINSGLSAATPYFYRLNAFNTSGSSAYTPVASANTFGVGAAITGNGLDLKLETTGNTLEVTPSLVRGRSVVRIGFSVAQEQRVRLQVFDTEGRMVQQLFEGSTGKGQPQYVNWNTGSKASGTYLVRLLTNQGLLVRRVVLMP